MKLHGPSSEILKSYELMSEIRAFEEIVAEGYRDGKLPGLLHLSMGSEATAVGVIASADAADRIYSSHRPHGHFLAAGSDPRSLMAELAGKDTGVCRGRAGSMHLMDDRAVMATGVVGGTLSIALGHSLTLPEGAIAIVFFGDGAVQTGTFHETMNMAALWKAPVLFVCENNGKIEFSSLEEHTTVADITRYGDLYGIPATSVDGSDVEAVAAVAKELISAIRSGKGPALLVSKVARLRPHYEGDLRRQEDAADPLEECIGRLVGQDNDETVLRQAHSARIEAAREMLRSVLSDDPAADPADDPGFVYSLALP